MQPGDAIFDHPTPLDGESTLPRLLISLTRLKPGPPFHVLVLIAPVAPELAPACFDFARRWPALMRAVATDVELQQTLSNSFFLGLDKS